MEIVRQMRVHTSETINFFLNRNFSTKYAYEINEISVCAVRTDDIFIFKFISMVLFSLHWDIAQFAGTLFVSLVLV